MKYLLQPQWIVAIKDRRRVDEMAQLVRKVLATKSDDLSSILEHTVEGEN